MPQRTDNTQKRNIFQASEAPSLLVRKRGIGNRMWEDIRNLKPEMSKSESLPIFLISKESASEEGLPTILTGPVSKSKSSLNYMSFGIWEWFNHEIVLIHPQNVGLLPPQLKARSQITFWPEHSYLILNSAQNIFTWLKILPKTYLLNFEFCPKKYLLYLEKYSKDSGWCKKKDQGDLFKNWFLFGVNLRVGMRESDKG